MKDERYEMKVMVSAIMGKLQELEKIIDAIPTAGGFVRADKIERSVDGKKENSKKEQPMDDKEALIIECSSRIRMAIDGGLYIQDWKEFLWFAAYLGWRSLKQNGEAKAFVHQNLAVLEVADLRKLLEVLK